MASAIPPYHGQMPPDHSPQHYPAGPSHLGTNGNGPYLPQQQQQQQHPPSQQPLQHPHPQIYPSYAENGVYAQNGESSKPLHKQRTGTAASTSYAINAADFAGTPVVEATQGLSKAVPVPNGHQAQQQQQNQSASSIARGQLLPPNTLEGLTRPPPNQTPKSASDLMKEGPRDYVALKDVGDGSFGTVFLADWKSPLPDWVQRSSMANPILRPQHANKTLVAIKRMKKQYKNWAECLTLNELKSLLAIPRHPNIIPLYDAFLMPSTRELHFVFECMEGNLYQLTKSRKGRPLATGLIISIFKDIIAGLHHIHAAGYFHRDLKPENLLLSTTGLCEYPNATKGGETERDVLVEVKIADFGLAREISSLPPYTEYVSTRWYRAPEVLLRARDYSAPVDIWAVGTIMAEVINLRPMFPGSSEVTQVISICEVLGTPSDDWGTESTGLPRGGGAWAKGMKMAKAVGFQWPKCPPVKFPELFSPRTPIGLIDVIHATLQYEPKRRLTTAGLIRHPFFNGQTTKMKPLRAKGLIVEETNAAHAADLARQQNEARIAAEEAAAAALRTSMRASEEPPRALPPSHAHSRDSIKPKFGATSPSVHEIPLPLVGGPAAHRTPFYPSTHAGDGETYAHLSLQAAAAAASSSGQRGTVYDVDMSSASHSANAPPLPAADLRDHHAMETDTSKPKKKMGWGSRIFGNQKEANAAAAAAAAASQTNKGQAQSYSHLPLSGAPPYAGPGVGTAMHGVSAVFNPSYASFGSGEVPSSGRDDGFSPYGPYGRGAGDYPAPASQSAVQISDESLYEVLQEGGKPRRRNRDAGPKVQPPPVEDNRSKQLLKKRAMQAGVGKELSAFELGGSFVQSVVGLHTQTNDEIFSVQGGDFDPDIVAAYGGANGQLQEELRPRDQSESGSNGQHDMYEPWEQQLNGAQANRYRQQTGASMQSHRSGESDPGPAYRRSFLPGGRRQGTAASSESVPSVFDRRYRGNSGVPSDMPSVFGNPQSRDGQSIHSVDSELVADMRKMFPRGDQASARGQSRGSANSVREASSPLHQPGINPPAAGRYHPYGAPNRPNSGRPHSGQQAAGLPSPMRHSPGVPRLADLRAAPVDHHRPSIPVRGHTSQDAFAPNGAQQTFEKTDYGYNVANNPQLSLPHPNYLGQAPQPVPWARTMPTRPQQPGTYPSLPSFKDFVADAEMDT